MWVARYWTSREKTLVSTRLLVFSSVFVLWRVSFCFFVLFWIAGFSRNLAYVESYHSLPPTDGIDAKISDNGYGDTVKNEEQPIRLRWVAFNCVYEKDKNDPFTQKFKLANVTLIECCIKVASTNITKYDWRTMFFCVLVMMIKSKHNPLMLQAGNRGLPPSKSTKSWFSLTEQTRYCFTASFYLAAAAAPFACHTTRAFLSWAIGWIF